MGYLPDEYYLNQFISEAYKNQMVDRQWCHFYHHLKTYVSQKQLG